VADDGFAVAVVGGTGLAGQEVVELLEHRRFPMRTLRLLGSLRTAGKVVEENERKDTVTLLDPQSFEEVDVAFFSAGPTIAGEFAPAAAAAGAAVIDLSSRFRLDEAVPLVVPEVNPTEIGNRAERGIVANPSSTAVALAVVLAPLAAEAGLKRVVVSTYQGAAGAGRRGINGLSRETMDLLSSRGERRTRFPRRLAFNCIPQVGELEPGGQTSHERQVVDETRKILSDPALAMQVTAVRVPVFFGTGLSVVVETERPLDADGARAVLRDAPGILLADEVDEPYPTPAEVAGSDATHVGRLREDLSVPGGLAFWAAIDNVRKGAALNAVQIAEILVRDYL
jgi:aspartate-semialdehyde dehydrogenase